MRDAEVVVRLTENDGSVHTLYTKLGFEGFSDGITVDTRPIYEESPDLISYIYRSQSPVSHRVSITIDGEGLPVDDDGRFMWVWSDE